MRLIFILFISFSPLFSTGFQPKEGDTFLFLGDSITHKGFYTQYVETYFVTRYPEKHMRFINSGISGDKARDVLNRFDEDVAIFKPNYISIMLGMNDGGYKDFDQEIFTTYKNDMAEILENIKKINAQAIVITPTIFDQQQYTRRTAEPDFRFNRLQASKHYNATMAFFGAWMREEAMKYQFPFINFWGPLNDLTVIQRQIEPTFTFNLDAIHPEAPGHAVMAASLIKDLNVERKMVSSTQAQFKKGQWLIKAKNAVVSQIEGNENELKFNLKAKSLPWVLPEEAALGYTLTKSGHKLSSERISISGLAPGNYRIGINGHDLGQTFSHLQLERKIEIQENSNTPQYQQAQKVGELILQKHLECIQPYRQLQAKMKGQRRKHGIDAPEISKFRSKLRPELNSLLSKSDEFDKKIHQESEIKELTYHIKKSTK